MILLAPLIILWLLVEGAVFLLVGVVLFAFVLFAGLFVGGSWLSYKHYGKWPSGRSLTLAAGSLFTLFLLVAMPSVYVLIGGAIGTAVAVRTADL